MKRILIVNPFGIGDVLFTTPLIANLKAAFPDSYIGYVCNARTKDILLNNPAVNKVFIYEKDKFRRLWRRSKIACIRKFFKFLHSIGKKKFDCAFDLSLGQEYGFFLWLIGIRTRIGYDYRKRGIFLTKRIKLEGYASKHIVDYYCDLARLLGIEPKQKDLEFPIDEKYLQWAADYLDEHEVGEDEIFIGLMPGGGASWGSDAYKKQWPAHRFADLGNQIVDKFRARLILFGDGSEYALCNQVASLIKDDCIMACGDTTLSRFAALLKRCTLVICNDGGPLHIAVSQGVKTISIFGAVDPLVYGPYPKNGDNVVITKDLPCQPCYKKFKMEQQCSYLECLSTIETSQIMHAVTGFLNVEGGAA